MLLLLASEFPNGSLFNRHTDTVRAERHHRLPMRSERDRYFSRNASKGSCD